TTISCYDRNRQRDHAGTAPPSPRRADSRLAQPGDQLLQEPLRLLQVLAKADALGPGDLHAQAREVALEDLAQHARFLGLDIHARQRSAPPPHDSGARHGEHRVPAARLSRRPSAGIRSTVTSTVRSWPSRMMITGTRVPGAVRATIRGSSRECCTRRSPQRTITSPRAIPALAAGPPDVTSATSAPSAPCRPNERARSGVTAWIATPTQPRTTAPC